MIVLSWPPACLSPNARVHWSVKAKATKAYRKEAGWKTIEAKEKVCGDGPIYLHVYFYPPDDRRRDGTNMLASLKSAFDGIADALHVNDIRFHVTYEVCKKFPPRGMVRVVVT